MLSHKNYAVTAGKVQLFYFQASSGTWQPASPCCSPNAALSRLGTRWCLQKRWQKRLGCAWPPVGTSPSPLGHPTTPHQAAQPAPGCLPQHRQQTMGKKIQHQR